LTLILKQIRYML